MKMSGHFNLFDFFYNLLSDSKIQQLVRPQEKETCLLLEPGASGLT